MQLHASKGGLGSFHQGGGDSKMGVAYICIPYKFMCIVQLKRGVLLDPPPLCTGQLIKLHGVLSKFQTQYYVAG